MCVIDGILDDSCGSLKPEIRRNNFPERVFAPDRPQQLHSMYFEAQPQWSATDNHQ
jgi:hypothetical protein